MLSAKTRLLTRVVSLRIRGFAARARDSADARALRHRRVGSRRRSAARRPPRRASVARIRARSPSGGGRRRGPGASRPRRGEPVGLDDVVPPGGSARVGRDALVGALALALALLPRVQSPSRAGGGARDQLVVTRSAARGRRHHAIAARGTAAAPPRFASEVAAHVSTIAVAAASARGLRSAGRSANGRYDCTPPESGAARGARAATTSRPARTFTKFEVFTRLRARVVRISRRRAGRGGPRRRPSSPSGSRRPDAVLPVLPRPASSPRGRRRSRSS